MTTVSIKVAFVFRPGPGEAMSGYRAASFRHALVNAGLDPLLLDVVDRRIAGAPAQSDANVVTCRDEAVPATLRQFAPDLVLTFGAPADLGAVWAAAADSGRPLMHFVRTADAAHTTPQGWLARAISTLASMLTFMPMASLPMASLPMASRHVSGVLGASRSTLSRVLEAGEFPAAKFSRVIAPPIELADRTTAPRSKTGLTFGVYDPRGTDETLRFIHRAVASTGHTDLFDVTVAHPSDRLSPLWPRNVSVVAPGSPQEFVDTIDALIVPYDADHFIASLLMVLRAGKTAIVPDGGVAAELINFGRDGVIFTAGSAYDLALKMNIVTRASGDVPFAFRGGEATARRHAPGEVAKALAETVQFALASAARA